MQRNFRVPFLESANTVDYGAQLTADTDRLWSRSLWKDCPWLDIVEGTKDRPGVAFFDDFGMLPLIGTQTTQIAYDKYKVFATSGAAVTPGSTVNSVEMGGGILALTHAADNDSASLAQAYPSFMVTGSKTNSGKLWFECRIATKSLLTLRNGFFVGLAETSRFTLATGVPFNADAAAPTAGGSLLGFNKLEIVPTVVGGINTGYTDRATSFSVLGTSEAVQTAAFTFIKLGFIYDPAETTNAVRFFANGVELATKLTKTQLAATTNLKANALGLMIASVAAGSVSTDATYLDWWRCAQLLPTLP